MFLCGLRRRGGNICFFFFVDVNVLLGVVLFGFGFVVLGYGGF